MGNVRLTLAAGMGIVALALVLPGLDTYGFWFDEAYTARLAALDWPRLLAGAQQDVHPPGWPLLGGVMLGLPVSAEVTLRLPSALCFAGLVALVAMRNPVAGGALVFYTPLVEQAAQARPYAPLAFGLVGLARLVERGAWVWAGVVAGLVASLHALAAPLCALVVIGGAFTRRPSWKDCLRFLAPALLLTGWWLPAFLSAARRYVDAPWYGEASSADWWIVADAGGAAAAAVLIVASQARVAFDRLVPALLVGGFLIGLDALGFGVEIRKTGLAILPLLLAGLGADRLGRTIALVCAALLLWFSVEVPPRPDLRQARQATETLPAGIPVISVFASEAAWYFRTPAPLPSFREPDAIARRVTETLAAQRADCLVSIALPGTFPAELPVPVRTIQTADVRGLDVRIVGTPNCTPPPASAPWREP